MKKSRLIPACMAAVAAAGCLCSCSDRYASGIPHEVTMSDSVLMDKIKGGWAGQTIGVAYGGPTEFRYKEEMIPDTVEIPWSDPDYVKNWMDEFPGLFDDIYMDLTFVEVIERNGPDVPVDSFAQAFANAEYMLWEANQTARYNILSGMRAPQSGHWLNNPHANDIDFQIEADFAGLMSPGMPNTAATICDSIGHIMNYGDGWYGGVYMAAMYSLAFVCDNVETVVTEALRCIPEGTRYHDVISDVIDAYHQDPEDWKAAWLMCAGRWHDEPACPTGVMLPYNIDAALNSAYVVIGLLYGGGDFGRTLEISTRCGQDSDCNPASAGGILGTMLGYSNIPRKWIAPLRSAEDIKFAYTSSSLTDAYRMSYGHAVEMIDRGGGTVSGGKVIIKCQDPVAVRYEQAFDGMHALSRKWEGHNLNEGPYVSVTAGDAVIFTGAVEGNTDNDNPYVAEVEVDIDGTVAETVKMPAATRYRKNDIYWNYALDGRRHDISLRLLNPVPDNKVVIYSKVDLTR